MKALLIILSVYLQACDPDIFPNIHLLLRIACTIQVTSADNERSNSTLKLVKGYLRTTMTTERLSGLALMSVHYEKPFDYDAVQLTTHVKSSTLYGRTVVRLYIQIFSACWVTNILHNYGATPCELRYQ